MFGRKKKDKDVVGVACPYCEYNNPLGAVTCEQCYYDLNKSARDQPMAEPTTSGEEIMSLLLGENEEDEDDVLEIVEAVLSVDDVTVEVDQYAVPETTTEEGVETNETFEFIGSQGPTLSQTVVAVEEEDDIALTTDDAPKEYVEFELDRVDPLAQVAEPVHTGKGGLYSPTVSAPNDDDLMGEVGPTTVESTPELPDLPEDEPPSVKTSLKLQPPRPLNCLTSLRRLPQVPRCKRPITKPSAPLRCPIFLKTMSWPQNKRNKNRSTPSRPLRSSKTEFGLGPKLKLGPPRRCIKKWFRPWSTSNTAAWSKRPTPWTVWAHTWMEISTCCCIFRC